MKVKFNRYERMAGIFVASAIVLSVVSVIGVAIQKGWFTPKTSYRTVFEKANGIFPGTLVEIAGLRAGAVTNVELKNENQVVIEFSVQSKFAHRIRKDSVVMSRRPFIIGDKILEVSVGSESAKHVRPWSVLKSKEGIDLLELGNPQKLAPFIDTFSRLTKSLVVIADAFTDPKRTRMVVEIFDKINPFLTAATQAASSVISVSDQLTKKKNLQIAVENFAAVSTELAKMVHEMPNMSKEMIEMIRQTSKAVSELNRVLPAMAEAAPQIPAATDKAMKAMDEAVVVLRAMQKSFLLRSSVKEVREEDDKRKVEDAKKRLPAGSDGSTKNK
ncbi:MAG: MlaD family protein [Bdellovibrionales bacterium]